MFNNSLLKQIRPIDSLSIIFTQKSEPPVRLQEPRLFVWQQPPSATPAHHILDMKMIFKWEEKQFYLPFEE